MGPFGCPHAVLRSCWANPACMQTSFARQGAKEERNLLLLLLLLDIIHPLPGVVTSILPMSHQAASEPGYVQSIVSSEVSTYRRDREGFSRSMEIIYLRQHSASSLGMSRTLYGPGFSDTIQITRWNTVTWCAVLRAAVRKNWADLNISEILSFSVSAPRFTI